jgi:hypothetical protein
VDGLSDILGDSDDFSIGSLDDDVLLDISVSSVLVGVLGERLTLTEVNSVLQVFGDLLVSSDDVLLEVDNGVDIVSVLLADLDALLEVFLGLVDLDSLNSDDVSVLGDTVDQSGSLSGILLVLQVEVVESDVSLGSQDS